MSYLNKEECRAALTSESDSDTIKLLDPDPDPDSGSSYSRPNGTKKGIKKKEYDGIMFEELSGEVKTSSKA
jgi:hypothetical protein